MRKGAEPLVSVVMPCFDTESYLAEAMESILGQTYWNWELIFLDNRSSDRSLAIAERYARKDARIRIHENSEFLDQLDNYNRALALISEDSLYTKVLEPDNWLDKDCLSEMVGLAERCPRTGIVSAYSMCETHLRFTGLPYAEQCMDGRETARRHFLDDAYLFGSPTTVLIRSEIVRARRPFFDASNSLCADLSAWFEILEEWDFGFVHQVLSFVRTQNEGSKQAEQAGLDPMALDRLAVLLRHGRRFMAEEEFELARRRVESRYYAHLGQAWLERRDGRYWEFHEAGLAELGLSLDRGLLTRHLLSRALSHAVNPGSFAAAVWRRLSARVEIAPAGESAEVRTSEPVG